MKRAAIRQSLSMSAAAGKIAVIEAFTSTDGRVKSTNELLAKMKLTGRVVVVVTEKTDLLHRATRNIAGLELVSAKYLNVYTIMNADHLVFTTEAIEATKAWLGEK
jgi:large subunit ribosomal protein L4